MSETIEDVSGDEEVLELETVEDEKEIVEIYLEDLEVLAETIAEYEADEDIEEKIEKTLFNARNIYLYGEINQSLIESAVAMIHYYNEEDKNTEIEDCTPINIFIASEGGEAYSGYNLVSAIERSKTPVHTYSEGTQLMSMGFIIFLAGEKRYMSRHSNPMYHQLSAGTQSTMKSMENDVAYYRRMQAETADYIAERTSIPLKKLRSYDKRNVDWHLTFKECKDYNVLTDVI